MRQRNNLKKKNKKIDNNNINKNEDEIIKDYFSEKSIDIDDILKKCQETSRKIRLNICDRLIGIECFHKYLKRKSRFYKSYYLGKDYFMKTMEVSVLLKDMSIQSSFVKFFLTEEQYKIFKYVSQPILNKDYAGTRYDRNNIPDCLAEKLGFRKE